MPRKISKEEQVAIKEQRARQNATALERRAEELKPNPLRLASVPSNGSIQRSFERNRVAQHREEERRFLGEYPAEEVATSVTPPATTTSAPPPSREIPRTEPTEICSLDKGCVASGIGRIKMSHRHKHYPIQSTNMVRY